MSLFATEKTVKVYFENDEIVDKETPDWFEVLETLPLEIGEEIKRRLAPARMQVLQDGSYSVDISSAASIPADILAKLIKGWSENVPVTVENVKKLDSRIVEKLWAHLQKMYGIAGGR